VYVRVCVCVCSAAIRFGGNTALFVQCSQSERHETQRFIIELLSRAPNKGILPGAGTKGRICNNACPVRVQVHTLGLCIISWPSVLRIFYSRETI